MQGMGGMLYSRECRQTFRGMSSNILGNVAKHSGEYPKAFPGMLLNIPGKVVQHSGEGPQTFQGNIHLLESDTSPRI